MLRALQQEVRHKQTLRLSEGNMEWEGEQTSENTDRKDTAGQRWGAGLEMDRQTPAE